MEMPINAIKKILKEEIEQRLNNIHLLNAHQEPINGCYHLISREFIDGIKESVMVEFKAIVDSKDAGEFLLKYYRMSLDEWIKSIKV